ncbi:MAG: hypothetical protein IKK83_00185 [Clostridia bacterium]|nr:hypothetical protein [Clostridia bacterium]
MAWVLLKIIAIIAILLLMCLPFFPAKFSFSLASKSYDGKERWKNLWFVIETAIVSVFLVTFAPYIKNALEAFFNLGFMQWLKDLLPERFVYSIDVVVLIAVNLGICFLFLFFKKLLRIVLDRLIRTGGGSSNLGTGKNKGNQKQFSPNKKTGGKDVSDKRLRILRKNSVLVFGKGKKDVKGQTAKLGDYTAVKKDGEKQKTKKKKSNAVKSEESVSFASLFKYAYNKLVAVFYDEEDEFEYVKPGTYRWAKEMKSFMFLMSCLYLLVCLAVLLPVFFSFSWFPYFYTIAEWLIDNTYMYPMLSLVMLFEILWFIDGEYKYSEEVAAPYMTFVSGVNSDKEENLSESRNAFLNKYGQSYNIKNFESTAMGGKGTYTLEEKSRAIQNMAKAIRASKGFVNGDYMQGVEHMFDGKHVLFDTSLYSSLGEYIVHYLFVVMSFGTRVLFICKDKKEIENASAFLEKSFKEITKTDMVLWRISTYERLHEGETPDILLLTPDQFLERGLQSDGKSFFEELVDVFVLDTDKIITENNYYCLIMAKTLEKATTFFGEDRDFDADSSIAVEKRIRYRFLSSGHIQALDNSIRQFFNLEDARLETFHTFGLASKTEVFLWRTGMSSTMYVDNGANQVALEVQIAKEARSHGITHISLISDAAVYSSQLNEISGLTINCCDLSDNSTGYVIVADDCFNLPNAIYNFSRFSGRKSTVLHVVSKPYLLREYFASRAESYASHFELIGKTMSEHADVKKVNIINLLCDAVNGMERSLFIQRASEFLGDTPADNSEVIDKEPDEKELERFVQRCYDVAFGEGHDYEPRFTIKKEQSSQLEYKTFVYLVVPARLFKKLLESTRTVRLEYVNTQNSEYLSVFKDEMAQHFVPGQVMMRNNRCYTIKAMDKENGVLTLDDTGPSVNVPMDYIQTRHYEIKNAELDRSFGHHYRALNSVVNHVGYSIYDADVSVDTVGYYSIEKAVQTVDLVKPNFAKYVDLSGDQKLIKKLRRDIKTKVLLVELDSAVECEPSVTYSLSVILGEFMKTLFPQQYRCVSVCPIFDEGVEEQFFEGNTAIRDLYPRIVDSFGRGEGENDKKRIRFAVIEDIDGGNGVVETLVDGNGIMVTNLLHVVADFLAWINSPVGQGFRYLHFGYDACPAVFDFAKLDEIVKQFRQDVERSELVRIHDDNTCFFCHKQVEDEELQELEDGRAICRSCSESSVGTFEGLEECFKAVFDALKANTSVPETFPSEIKADFVSTKELRERFGDVEEVLPIAYCNHLDNSIYLEYGLPKAALCGAIARMITELWQDNNVSNDGSAIYGGHLDLVELQALLWLKYGNEANLLRNYYQGREGLAALEQALKEFGSQDSFAYFLGKSGIKNGEKPGEDEEDIPFIAERDPKTLPRFLYSLLSEDEKAIYDQICTAVCQHQESTGELCRPIVAERCREILYMVKWDNPHIIWCAHSFGTVMRNSENMAVNVVFKYVLSPSEAQKRVKKIEKSIKPFLKGIKPYMSDYEVALRAHENIVSLIDYDSISLDIQDNDPEFDNKPDNLRSVYGVFVEKKAVCAGYAVAFQYLLHRMGIECAYVRGPCHDGEWHAWNLVKLEGEYYYVDVTFDDHTNTDIRKNGSAEISYDYFDITTAELLKSRNIQNAEIYPECKAVKCNYFVRSNMFFEGYNAKQVAKIVKNALKAGKKEVALKAASPEVLAVIRRKLISEGGINDILSSLNEKKKCTIYSYLNEELNILHIILDK